MSLISRILARPDAVERERSGNHQGAQWGQFAAAVAVVVALSVIWWKVQARAPEIAPPTVGSVDGMTGSVSLTLQNEDRRVKLGRYIHVGSEIVVSDDSRLSTRLLNHQSVRFNGGTTARFATRTRIELKKGAVYVDSSASPDATTIAVGAIQFIPAGTQFVVSATAGTSELRVRDGRVQVIVGAQPIIAERGEVITISPQGAISRGSIAPDDSSWKWAIEPMT